MKVLALDTATEACSCALWVNGELHGLSETVGRSHTQRLPAMVAELLAMAALSPAQLDGVVCGIGPGSFAGVRIGVAYAKGLALIHDRPLVAVDSLLMLAASVSDADRVLSVIDARLGGLYLAAHVRGDDGEWVAARPPLLCTPETIPAAPVVGRWVGVGSGFAVAEAALRSGWRQALQSIDAAALPQAKDVIGIGVRRLLAGQGISAAALAPLYLRDKVALTHLEQQAKRAQSRPPPPP